jgi:hypothetical protein
VTRLQLDASIKESKDMVLKALERTDGINQYQESKHQIVGKTGVSFPRVLWSYGENIYIDFSETQFSKTEIEVSAEKEISVNIGSDPQKFKRRFLDELDSVRNSSKSNLSEDSGGWGQERGEDIEDPIPTVKTEKREASVTDSYNITKVDEKSMSSGTSVATAAVILVLIFISFFFFLILFI